MNSVIKVLKETIRRIILPVIVGIILFAIAPYFQKNPPPPTPSPDEIIPAPQTVPEKGNSQTVPQTVQEKGNSQAITMKPSLGFSKDAKLKYLLKKILHQRGINDWNQVTLMAEFERSRNACSVEVLILVDGTKRFHGEGIGLTLQSERPVPSKKDMRYRALEHCLSELLIAKDGKA